MMADRSGSLRSVFVLVVVAMVGLLSIQRASDAAFVRGDSNQDGSFNISDASFTLDFLFQGGSEPTCPAAADTNDDETIDISDAIVALEHLFLGGSPPPPPFPEPGSDPTPGLGCGSRGPGGLVCRAVGPAVDLSWQNAEGYDEIEVRRDGDPVATLPASAEAFHDTPPSGGDHDYAVVGVSGHEESDPTTCTLRGLPDNRPPTLRILSPAPGVLVSADSFTLRGRVDDETAIARVVVDGEDLTVAAGVSLPHIFSATVTRHAADGGPKLVRVEAVDEFGRAAFGELAVGFGPLLREGASGPSLTLAISGGSGYDEIEAVARPFLAGLPSLLDDSVRGTELYNGNIVGVDVRVIGRSVEVIGPIGLDLFPSSANGGRVGLRASIQRLRFFADGSSDFGFLGTDDWDAIWTGDDITITGAVAFSARPDGKGLDVTSDGFVVDIARSDFSVSGFLDPLGVFDALVNSLGGLFTDQIEASVRDGVESAAEDEIVPLLADAFSGLRLDLALGAVALETSFDDVVEGSAGMSLLFDGEWNLTDPVSPGYPSYPGSYATAAPFPSFPLSASPGHAVDATISLSADTLNQALAGLTSTGLLVTDLGFDDVESPIPLNVGTIAAVLDPCFLELEGVDADDPLAFHVEARHPLRVTLDEGAFGVPVVAVGEDWRWVPGTSEPPSGWVTPGFRDGNWRLGPSGFGYSSNAAELRSVGTVLEEMAAGDYTSIYLRRSFTIDDVDAVAGLVLRVEYDDAFVAYLNGVEVGRRNIGEVGTRPSHDDLAGGAGEPARAEIDLLDVPSRLRDGVNVIAIQGHNASATSSDFVLVPEISEALAAPAGTITSMPAQLIVEELEVSFVADTDGDGVGEDDTDGEPDEVPLFSYSLGLRLQTQLLLIIGDDEVPTLVFRIDAEDGPDPDSFPDGIVGGLAEVDIGVAGEAFDVDDAALEEFAELVLSVFGPSLGETLEALDLPIVPLPELAFDLDDDGVSDVRLEIRRGTFATADTTSDGAADWVCILCDLRSVSE